MPFTPFHFGPALFIGVLGGRWLNLLALFVASVILDLEGLFFLLTSYGAVHGVWHSYTMATVIALIVAIITYLWRKKLAAFIRWFGLKDNISLRAIVISSFIGAYLHIFLDSFMYSMQPFWPLSSANPQLGMLSSSGVYALCAVLGLIGLALYLREVLRK